MASITFQFDFRSLFLRRFEKKTWKQFQEHNVMYFEFFCFQTHSLCFEFRMNIEKLKKILWQKSECNSRSVIFKHIWLWKCWAALVGKLHCQFKMSWHCIFNCENSNSCCARFSHSEESRFFFQDGLTVTGIFPSAATAPFLLSVASENTLKPWQLNCCRLFVHSFIQWLKSSEMALIQLQKKCSWNNNDLRHWWRWCRINSTISVPMIRSKLIIMMMLRMHIRNYHFPLIVQSTNEC